MNGVPNLEISVRQFDLLDLPRIFELEKVSFPIDAFREETFIDYFHKQPDLFLVAESESSVIGYILASVISIEKCLIVSIAIDPAHKRKGVGRILAEHIFNRLLLSGVKKIELRVRSNNEEGQQFWRSLGFEPDIFLPNFYNDKAEALQMVKSLGA